MSSGSRHAHSMVFYYRCIDRTCRKRREEKAGRAAITTVQQNGLTVCTLCCCRLRCTALARRVCAKKPGSSGTACRVVSCRVATVVRCVFAARVSGEGFRSIEKPLGNDTSKYSMVQ